MFLACSGAKETKWLCLMNRFYIAGFQYCQGGRMIKALKTGRDLKRVPGSGNQHDRLAVKILFSVARLGHVSGSDNKHRSRLLRNGAEVRRWITERNSDNLPWERVKVELGFEV
jgi:hypothetical protein